MVCVIPEGNAFSEDVSFSLVYNRAITMKPETIKADLGDSSTCGWLGAASTA